MNPLISVIIPAYNKGELIKETIDSVLAQTYSNFEIILVDDGSIDNTAEVVRSIKDSRLKYHYQPNSGLPAKPRNKGVALSNGEYIAFLDHDDVWLAQKLEKQLLALKQYENIALVSTNAYFIRDNIYTKEPLITDLKSGYFNDEDFLPEIKVIQSSVLIKKSVFLEMKGFDESPDLKAREDYDLWLRMYHRYSCYYLNECLIYYRKYDTSTSGNELAYVKTSLDHYNKYFVSYGFSNKINNIKLSNILHHLACLQFLSNDSEYLGNSKKAFKLNKNMANLMLYLFFLFFPRKFTIKLYQLKKQLF